MKQRRAILVRDEAELLGQVGMTHDLKQAGFRRLCEAAEIFGPHFVGIMLLPLREFMGIVDVPPVGNVMY